MHFWGISPKKYSITSEPEKLFLEVDPSCYLYKILDRKSEPGFSNLCLAILVFGQVINSKWSCLLKSMNLKGIIPIIGVHLLKLISLKKVSWGLTFAIDSFKSWIPMIWPNVKIAWQKCQKLNHLFYLHITLLTKTKRSPSLLGTTSLVECFFQNESFTLDSK